MKNYKSRILFILPDLRRAGAETQIVNLVNAIDKNKFKIYLFTFEKDMAQESNLCRENLYIYKKIRRYKLDFDIIRSIKRIINEENIDIIHCTLQISLLYGWLGRLLSKKRPKLVAAVHTTKNRSIKEDLYDILLYQFVLKRCNAIIFVCKNQAKHWGEKYRALKHKATVIYNGVDISHFDAKTVKKKSYLLKSTLGIPEKSKVLCCIAGFRSEKGHHDLIEAFSYLDSNTYLILAGNGKLRDEIEQLVIRKRLQERVIFLGLVEDVRPILKIADISIIASTAVETFSMAVLESMSMAVPVIATNIGGMAEIIFSGETGELVEPSEPKLLGKIISDLLNHPNNLKRMQHNCREIVSKFYNIDRMTRSTEELFIRLLLSY